MEQAGNSAREPSLALLTTCAIDIESTATCVRVSLMGELDTVDSGEVSRLLYDAATAGKPVVRLDLSGLTFADSSAISAILLCAQAAERNGATLQIVNPRPRLQHLFDITGLSQAFNVMHES